MLIIENMGGTDKEEVIQNAIDMGYTITFFYMGKDYEEKKKKGENPVANYRRVEPFALGKTKSGNPILRGYQYVGATNSKNGVYKTYRIDQIKGDIKYVYDNKGEAIRSFEPRTYQEKRRYKDGSVRSVTAAYRDDGTDKHMKGGVKKYFDVDGENLVDIPNIQPTTTPKVPTKTNVQPGIPVPKPKTSVKPPTLPVKQKEPIVPSDEESELDQLNKITQDQNRYDTEDQLDESSSSGFFKWVLNLYGR